MNVPYLFYCHFISSLSPKPLPAFPTVRTAHRRLGDVPDVIFMHQKCGQYIEAMLDAYAEAKSEGRNPRIKEITSKHIPFSALRWRKYSLLWPSSRCGSPGLGGYRDSGSRDP